MSTAMKLEHCQFCNNKTETYISSHSGHPCCLACKTSRITNKRDCRTVANGEPSEQTKIRWLELEVANLRKQLELEVANLRKQLEQQAGSAEQVNVGKGL